MGNRFGVTTGFVRPILVKDILRPKPVECHMRPPLVISELKFLTQVGQVIDAPDESNPFEPFVFECFVDPFGDGNGTDL
jgi:hypothetical protein